MSTADTIFTDWANIAAAWAILGVILLIMEITLDGSKVFFLPMGLAAMIVGLVLHLQKIGVTPTAFSFLTSWNRVLIAYAICALVFAIILRVAARHRHIDDTPDVNDY